MEDIKFVELVEKVINNKKEKCRRLTAKVAELEEKIEVMEADKYHNDFALKSEKRTNGLLKRKLEETQAEVESKNLEIVHKTQQIEDLNQDHAEYTSTIERIDLELRFCYARIIDMKEERIEELEDELEKITGEAARVENKLQSVVELLDLSIVRFEETFESSQKKNKELKVKLTEQKTKNQKLEEEIENLKQLMETEAKKHQQQMESVVKKQQNLNLAKEVSISISYEVEQQFVLECPKCHKKSMSKPTMADKIQ